MIDYCRLSVKDYELNYPAYLIPRRDEPLKSLWTIGYYTRLSTVWFGVQTASGIV